MEYLFFRILNMSVTASILIAVVIVLRLALKRAPKWISCLLWAIVAVRLVCPFSIESVLSLIPSAEPVPQSITMVVRQPEIQSSSLENERALNLFAEENAAPAPEATPDSLRMISLAAPKVWVCGAAVMLIYALVSYLVLRRKIKASMYLKGRVRICDDIQTPFILGIIKPRIYIPSNVSDGQLGYIIAHERAHLKRKDHLWKPFGFLVLSVHWFNPFVWAAYVLLCRDIELACDEKVIKDMEKAETISYSETLLSCSVDRRSILVCPLAFGEVGVKERIRHVLNYRKPAFWVIIAAVSACAAVAVFFLTDPKENGERKADAIVTDEPSNAQAEPDAGELKAGNENIPSQPDVTQIANSLDGAIREAIKGYFSDGSKDVYSAAGFVPLHDGTDLRAAAGTQPSGEKKNTLEFIGMAMYMTANVDETGIHELSGNHSLAEISFIYEDGKYRLEDIQMDYAFDGIPVQIADMVKSDERYLYANGMSCYEQIIQEAGIQTFPLIGRNIDLTCEMANHPMTLQNSTSVEALSRELVYYGEFTLAYRDKFYGELSDERRKILDRACSRIETVIASGYHDMIMDESGEIMYLKSLPTLLTKDELDYIEKNTVNGEIEIPRLINVNGNMYYQNADVGIDISVSSPDEEIKASEFPLPHVPDSSNFGTGYQYVRQGDGYCVKIGSVWYVFELFTEFGDVDNHYYYADDTENGATLASVGDMTFTGTIMESFYDFKTPTILVKPDASSGIMYDLISFELPDDKTDWLTKTRQHVVITCSEFFFETDPVQGVLIDIGTP